MALQANNLATVDTGYQIRVEKRLLSTLHYVYSQAQEMNFMGNQD
jgi:hypothetical protein